MELVFDMIRSVFLFFTALWMMKMVMVPLCCDEEDHGAKRLRVNEQFAREANFSDEDIYQEAKKDRIGYWEKLAGELAWFKKWDLVLEWNPPYAKWFASGTLNVSYNCLDRHIDAGLGDKTALIHINEGGERQFVTYQQLYQDVNRIANVMKHLGVEAGDRVAIYMPMMPEAIASMLACNRIGAVHTVVFGGIGSVSVKERIMDADAKLLVTADGSYRSGKTIGYKTTVDSALDECSCLEKVLVFRNIGVNTYCKTGRDYWYHEIKEEVASYCKPAEMGAEDPLFILYTSGTTGKPKGILHTTGGYLVGAHSSFYSVFDIKPKDVYWCTADVGWITGHTYVVYGPLSNAATQVIYEGGFDYPSKNRFAEIIDSNGVTIFYTAPTLVRMFMQWGDVCLKGGSFQSLRLLGSIGEPINPEAWEWFFKYIGRSQCPIVDTWFQTETGSLVISPLPGITPLKPGSVTKALPGYEVAIFDENGDIADKGFLAITEPYPSMMRGLYKDHDRFVSTYWSKWDGKYYFAGDYATVDEDGYIWIGGRCDEVLKVSGHRIGTAEIENALIECPDVAESAVVGVKDELKGQKIVAFVILKEGVQKKDDLECELKNLVATLIGGYARPARIVFVENLPKTRSGKILRRVLKNLVEGEPVGNTATLNVPGVIDELTPICKELYNEFYLPSILLGQISAKPQFGSVPSPIQRSSAAIVKIVTPLLQKHLEETNYDRLSLTEQFLEEFLVNQRENPSLTVLGALAAFNPEIGVNAYGCWSLTDDMLKRLPNDLNAYKIGSNLPLRFKQPGQSNLSHNALVVLFENPHEINDQGVVLIDPNFDIEVPIVLIQNGPQVTVNMKAKGEWSFMLHQGKILCFTEKLNPELALEENAAMIYSLENYLNPIQVGVKASLAADRKISVVSRNSFGKEIAHLNVHFPSGTVLWSLYEEKQPPISFENFLLGKGFNKGFAKLLKTTALELNSSIRKIILHKEVFSQLNVDFLALIAGNVRKNEFFLTD
jgi:acetyl-CoA synthetase